MLSYSPTNNIFCKFALDFRAIELAHEINNFIKKVLLKFYLSLSNLAV